MESDIGYVDICRGKGVNPLLEVIKVMQGKEPVLVISQKTKLTEADIFCLSRTLEENYSYLVEINIQGQVFSPSSINVLSQGLKSNHVLKKLSMTEIKFTDLSMFYKISEALTLNEALTTIDLSSNSLDDSTSNALLELLGVLPYLKQLHLDYNKLKNIEWGNILAVNTSLEHLSLGHNELSYQSVANLLESLLINRSLKVLNVLECERSVEFNNNISGVLSQVTKVSILQSLFIDLDNDIKNIELLTNSLVEYNSSLVELGYGEGWKKANKELHMIWGAIQANRWISLKLLNYSADYEIEEEFQEILELKLSRLKELEAGPSIKIEENEIVTQVIDTPQFSSYTSGKQFKLDSAIEGLEKAEDELIAQVYNSPRDDHQTELYEEKSLISNSVFNDSPRNFTYSESSNTGTPNLESPRLGSEKIAATLLNIQKGMKVFDDKYMQSLDSVKGEIAKEAEYVSECFGELQVQMEAQKVAGQKLQEILKENEKAYLKKEKAMERVIESLEQRLSAIEKNESVKKSENLESRSEINELRENSRELNAKIEKYELNMKLQINSLKKNYTKKQELCVFQDKQNSLTEKIQAACLAISSIEPQVEKFKQVLHNLQKTEKTNQKKSDEAYNTVGDLKIKLQMLEEKLETQPSFEGFSQSFNKEIDSKLSRLELKLWDALDSDCKNDLASGSFKTLDKKIHLIDEKVNRINENIRELSRDLLKIESFNMLDRFDKLEKDLAQVYAFKKSQNFMSFDQKKPLKASQHVDNSRSTSAIKPSYSKRPSPYARPPSANAVFGRTEEGEKNNTEKASDYDRYEYTEEKNKFEAIDFLPGEAESIVMSAIIDKANKARTPQLRKSFSSSCFVPVHQSMTLKSQTQYKKFLGEELSPSLDLQESLKLRGINL